MRRTFPLVGLVPLIVFALSGCSSDGSPIDIRPDPKMTPQPPAQGGGCEESSCTPWSVTFGPAGSATVTLSNNQVIRVPSLKGTSIDWEIAKPENEALVRGLIERTNRAAEAGDVNLFWKGTPIGRLGQGNETRASMELQFDGDDWFPIQWSGNAEAYAFE